ncbi:hypothetical protein [Rudaeicoccus suwonensis]|uniref:Uncharacterized protein n=1 Tax=Rudaeicoccus suwonensis TaxID=657409 RepID=A0A561E781_9MICO|nr:hypothetical protein [Rudaeicoccus suwonensis]TWE11471.1 hypothetical protein BKA23_0239 [Rudaeicoccus suwonensis]
MTNLQIPASIRKLEELETSVLFDVASQAATELGGTYVWLEDHAGSESEAEQWRAADLQLRRERRELHPDDREAVIAAVCRWGSECRRLDEQHGLR